VQNAKERPSKVALIVKAAVHGDCRNRRVGLAEGGARLLYTVAIQVLDGSKVKAFLEMPLKGAEGEAALFREILQLDFLSIV